MLNVLQMINEEQHESYGSSLEKKDNENILQTYTSMNSRGGNIA